MKINTESKKGPDNKSKDLSRWINPISLLNRNNVFFNLKFWVFFKATEPVQILFESVFTHTAVFHWVITRLV